jgi:hypothetical protein
MALSERIALYQQIEHLRGKPLIVYVTSIRANAHGQIAQDAVSELLNQLQSLPRNVQDLDLLIVSNGGDGTVAWRSFLSSENVLKDSQFWFHTTRLAQPH